VRVLVNRETCTGNGLCEALLPELFEVAEEGIVRVLSDPADDDLRDLVDEAVISCPTRSLSIAGIRGPGQ
jgi:ferredoxin